MIVKEANAPNDDLPEWSFVCKVFSHQDNEEVYPHITSVPKNLFLRKAIRKKYEPTENQLHFIVNKYSQRLIFYGDDELTEKEETELEKFYEWITKKNKPQLPEKFPVEEILRTLHGQNWNYKKTY